MTLMPGPALVDVGMDVLVFTCLHLNTVSNTNTFNTIKCFFVELLYLLQTSKHQGEDDITLSYILTLVIKEAPANR